jgi:hypothetical protein
MILLEILATWMVVSLGAGLCLGAVMQLGRVAPRRPAPVGQVGTQCAIELAEVPRRRPVPRPVAAAR